MATLYNTARLDGNGCLFFLLIVFILAFECAWKTGFLLWITWLGSLGHPIVLFSQENGVPEPDFTHPAERA